MKQNNEIDNTDTQWAIEIEEMKAGVERVIQNLCSLTGKPRDEVMKELEIDDSFF